MARKPTSELLFAIARVTLGALASAVFRRKPGTAHRLQATAATGRG
jgi:hypothetical protein